MRFFKQIVAVLAIAPLVFSADVLPDVRKSATWDRASVGVVGGIPSGSGWTVLNVVDFGADPTGVANSQSAYDAAVAASTEDSIIYFPAGTYKMNLLYVASSRRIVRGAGMFNTTIKPISKTASASIQGIDAAYGASGGYNVTGELVSGFTKGSTSVRVRKTGGISLADPFVAGKIVLVEVPNDWEQPVMTYNQTEYLRRLYFQVTGVTSHGGSPAEYTLTLASPVPEDYVWTDVALNVKFEQAQPALPVTKHTMGLEDLTIDAIDAWDGYDGADYAVGFTAGAYNSWMKNVRVKNYTNYGIFVDGGVTRIEIRGCFIQAPAAVSFTSRAGMVFYNISSSLIEDNIIAKLVPGIMVNYGSIGNVFGYNAILEDHITLPGPIQTWGGAIGPNHSAHPSFNLWEGNIASSVNADSYHGSGDGDLFHANWIVTYTASGASDWNTTTGLLTTSAYPTWGIAIKRFSRRYGAIGNIFGHPGFTYYNADNGYFSLGNPNIGNSSYYLTQSLTGVDGASPWQDYNTTTKKPYKWDGTITDRRNYSEVLGFYTTFDVEISSGDTTRMNERITRAVANHFNAAAQFLAYPPGGQGSYYTGGDTTTTLVGNTLTINNAFLPVPAVGTSVTITPGPLGFQELDLDVRDTMLISDNKRADGTVVELSPLGGGETRSASYYYASQPGFMTGYSWPPFDTASIGTLTVRRIPAGDRYMTFLENGNFDSTTVATPQFSPAPGWHATGTNVTITTSTSGATIYYTVDGSTPTTGSSVYSSPIVLPNGTTQVRSFATKSGMSDSAIQSGTYVVGTTPTAPSGLNATTISTTQINLSWLDNSSIETGFRVERRIGAGAWVTVATTSANAVSYSNTGLTPSTTYEYRIIAFNGAGDSAASNTDTATTQSDPSPSSANILINGAMNVNKIILQ